MKSRCLYSKNKEFKNYGGRGISICKEWVSSFAEFYNWATLHGWTKGLTIERRNVNGNYEPINCEWATWKQQANNKRNSLKNRAA